MMEAGMQRNRIYSISELNEYLRDLLENDRLLQNIWLRGEISDFKYYQKSGHMYFTLKDEEASISCVMFKGRARGLDFVPDNGMKVLARGYVSVFEKYGRYQFYVEEMEPDGLGRLFLQLTQLKEKLEKEGLFDPSRKRPLPAVVNRLGVVTSADGAALRDIVRVVRQRHPGCDIILAPASVQGAEAPAEIVAGIEALNHWGGVQVIIVGRGGGSFEDLWAFNTEEVVRAIASSLIPVISAVGHEVDFSLSDLAADVRAATPTQAAQLAVPDIAAVTRGLKELTEAMCRSMERKCNMKWAELDYLRERRIFREPLYLVESRKRDINQLLDKIRYRMESQFTAKENQLRQAGGRLEALSPLKVLERGFAVVRSEDGQIVKDAAQVQVGDTLSVVLNKGELLVKVGEKRVKEWRT